VTSRLITSREQAGSVAPLIIGFTVVVALLVAVVVDASAAYLRRQGLNSAADAAALAATDGIQGEHVYTRGLGRRAEINAAAARRHVEAYFATSGIRRRFPGLDYSVETRADTVVVRVVAPMDLPLRVPGAGSDVRVTGSAASVVVVSD
jgi:Flp pilus assembly protein TadG